VLVHNSDQFTYVAERHLEADSSSEAVNHPAIELYFDSFENGVYKLSARKQ
jgi:heat shock protein HspQ